MACRSGVLIFLLACVGGCAGSERGDDQQNAPTEQGSVAAQQHADQRVGGPAETIATSIVAGGASGGRLSDGTPVIASATIEPTTLAPGSEATLLVRVQIAPSWHIYAAEGATGANQPTRLELSMPRGWIAVGPWESPAAAPTTSPFGPVGIYSGEAIFKRIVRAEASASLGPASIACKVRYQACNPTRCLPPDDIELSVPIHLVAAEE